MLCQLGKGDHAPVISNQYGSCADTLLCRGERWSRAFSHFIIFPYISFSKSCSAHLLMIFCCRTTVAPSSFNCNHPEVFRSSSYLIRYSFVGCDFFQHRLMIGKSKQTMCTRYVPYPSPSPQRLKCH